MTTPPRPDGSTPNPGSPEAIALGCRIVAETITADDARRFWAKVDKDSDGDCWLWTAATFKTGYGAFRLYGQALKAHRVSYAMANGETPRNLHVLHRCDNPVCVNPSHLFLGTPRDNMRDMSLKGRANPSKGEASKTAKLTQADVDEIRRSYRADELDQAQLAAKYRLHAAQISRIINGRKWSDSYIATGGTPKPLRARRLTGTYRKVGESNPQIPCACGCGTTIDRYDRYGRPRDYVSGHNATRRRSAASGKSRSN